MDIKQYISLIFIFILSLTSLIMLMILINYHCLECCLKKCRKSLNNETMPLNSIRYDVSN